MELDAQAVINALTMQRNRALDDAAQLAAILTQTQARLAVLEAQLKKEEKQE
jgi:hypothetical protein